jgi:NAD+ synthase
MRPEQQRIISSLSVSPAIDPAAEVESRVGFLVEYLRATGAAGLVLGVSGGQDSSLAGRLCQLAVERVRSGASDATGATGTQARFIAVRLPYTVQADEDDAQLALQFIRPDHSATFNIALAVDGIAAEFTDALGEPITDFGKGNVKRANG